MHQKRQIHIVTAILFCVFLVAVPARPASAEGGSTATGLSRAFNPAIGANGLFLATYTDRDAGDEDGHDHGSAFDTGLRIQEVEIGLRAVVDPYMRAQFTLAMHGVDEIEIEEFYAQTTSLPKGFGILAGKTYLPFGKHNRLHTHAFPFIDGPLIHSALLGGHGLNDTGLQLSYLVPLPWFSETTVAAVYPGHESPFAAEDEEDLVYVANWRNLWDLADSTTFELGTSWAGAQVTHEAVEGLTTPFGHLHHEEALTDENGCAAGLHFVGADVTVKHVSTRYRSWDVSVEYLQGLGVIDDNLEMQYGGITGYGRFQLSRRWWVQARGDFLGIPMKEADEADHHDHEGEKEDEEGHLEDGDNPWRASGMVACVLTEFTALRLQYDHIDRIVVEPEDRVMLQLNITFGAHPAHSY